MLEYIIYKIGAIILISMFGYTGVLMFFFPNKYISIRTNNFKNGKMSTKTDVVVVRVIGFFILLFTLVFILAVFL